MPKDDPIVIRERNGYRLVHQVRDQITNPLISDLTMEEKTVDAMGNVRWTYVNSWCLSPHSGILRGDDYAHIALKLLVDPTHDVVKPR